MSKPEIGDIVEIKTSKGLAYAQLTHQHEIFGSLIRVFPGFSRTRPTNFDDLVNGPERFVAFVPLAALIRKGSISIVGKAIVPSHARSFPLFRSGVTNPKTRRVETWSLWDGQKTWKIGGLSEEQKKLPIRSIWTEALLFDRVECGWSPESSPDVGI